MDEHFRTAPFEDNIPVMLGLTGVWNTTFLGYPSLAILPYTQALSKLAPHIQQVSRMTLLHTLIKVSSMSWSLPYISVKRVCPCWGSLVR